MTFKSKLLITVLVVVAFDAGASLLSRLLQFDYTNLTYVSFLIYVLAGYWGAHRRGFVLGVLLGGLAGLSDATIGWSVSTWIGPFTRTAIPPVSSLLVLIVVPTVTVLGIFFGLIGATLCKLFGQTKRVEVPS